ncbi:glycosyltransferase [Lachnoclostridium phytofermentans]|uniref:glycosyltransferase n=1 Tax=Lachnoclostridium phytofermentans TaxID=66219 RepID=UPI0004984B20|nr:glycosyltransferase [Lachnoclostridium phytofermentans]
MDQKKNLDVIIPLFRPDKKFDKLLIQLLKQTIKPKNIWLLNTEVLPDYATETIKQRVDELLSHKKIVGSESVNIHIISIDQREFDHGGTRAYGASLSDSEYMVFMTQDAIPKDEHLLENLVEPLRMEEVAISYGRQEASQNATLVEKYTRIFNYPSTDQLKSKEDLDRLGIKTYFSSNVCAAYRKSVYEDLGGFVARTIFNEDMIYAAGVIKTGYKIYYASKATVIHSHHYTLMQQLRRNFDLGVSQEEYQSIFKNISSEKEGTKFVKQTVSYLKDQRKYIELVDFILESGFKYLGYLLGKKHRLLPQPFKIWLSMNKSYWR